MAKRFLAALIAGSLWLSGCEILTSTNLPLPRGHATLQVKAEFVSGGFRPLALVEAYDEDDVAELILSLTRLEGEQEFEVAESPGRPARKVLSPAEWKQPVRFDGLLPRTTYRIRAQAYKAPGGKDQDLISTSDASSYVDVVTRQDDAPISTSLKVTLLDVLFNGMASASGVVVIPGGYSSSPLGIDLGEASELIGPESAFWQEVSPAPRAGMTWVYAMTQPTDGPPQIAEIRMEVSQVNGNVVSYHVTISPEGGTPESHDQTGDLRRVGGFPDTTGRSFVHGGQESVTVPAGTYPEAIRLVNRTSTMESILWVVEGVGRVREEQRMRSGEGVSEPMIMQLKEFIAP